MSSPIHRHRRAFLIEGGLALGGLGLGLGACRAKPGARGLTAFEMQLGWLAGGNQLGEVVAQRLGYFAEEGLRLTIHPGGANIDGVGIVASGRYALGSATSSPSIMLAVSQSIPIQCFAAGVQKHPYAYFSLPDNPVREPSDLRGKRVGIQPTGRILLRALLQAHDIREDEFELVVVGSSLVPLLTGQVDVITGWSTNATALRQLGADRVTMRLWDSGIRLYAMPYYATRETIERSPEQLSAFLRAAGKGWALAHRDLERAVALVVEQYPILRYEDELRAARAHLPHVFTEATLETGWATMSPESWRRQIDLYERLGQFRERPPRLDEVMTMAILDATAETRPRLGAPEGAT